MDVWYGAAMTPDHARLMARYNAWQNDHLLAAADTLSDDARWDDRGAFFGSIAQTLNHVLWDDAVWLARIMGDASEVARLDRDFPYTEEPRDWAVFRDKRQEVDASLVRWAAMLTDDDLAAGRSFDLGADRVETTVAVMAAQLFNHQTHHRGQVHAMLTAAGAETAPTDLMMMVLGRA
ncbi:MAG: DinB family protein [Pseudomonadota bacterium]